MTTITVLLMMPYGAVPPLMTSILGVHYKKILPGSFWVNLSTNMTAKNSSYPWDTVDTRPCHPHQRGTVLPFKGHPAMFPLGTYHPFGACVDRQLVLDHALQSGPTNSHAGGCPTQVDLVWHIQHFRILNSQCTPEPRQPYLPLVIEVYHLNQLLIILMF